MHSYAAVRPKELRQFELMYDPRAAACCQHGQIVVCDSVNKLHVHEAGGREVRTATTNFKPWDIKSFQDKHYVTECDTDNGRVFVFNSELDITDTITVGYNKCGRVAVTDEFMYVTSRDEDIVYRVEISGWRRQKVLISGGVRSAQHVATNGRKVVVGSNSTHTVWVYDTKGNLQFKYGGEGSCTGQLKHPWGVAIDQRDTVFICDAFNNRVCIVSPQGHHMGDISLGSLSPRGVVVTSPYQLMITCSTGFQKPGVVTFHQY